MNRRSVGVAVLLIAVWLPVPSSATHYLGHGLNTQPSQQQIDKFCKDYPRLIKSPI